MIAVTATDYTDKPFATRGKYIAVAAPGVDIMVGAPGNTYRLTTGTSVAAAHVSGVAALLVERKPTIMPDAVRDLLIHTAQATNVRGKDEFDGAGHSGGRAFAAAAAEIDRSAAASQRRERALTANSE